MTEQTIPEKVDELGKLFTQLTTEEAFVALTSSAVHFFLSHVDASDFDHAWRDWGRIVRNGAREAAMASLEKAKAESGDDMETVGNA